MFIRRIASVLIAALAMAGMAILPSRGDEPNHDAVRRAVEQGEIKPLAVIADAVRDKMPGEIVGTEIERKKGRWLYEFRTVDHNGRVHEVYVDAATGTIERIKEK